MLPFLFMLETDEERELFADMYEKNRQAMYLCALGFFKEPADAEDVVHDVFCTVADRCMADLSKKSEEKRSRFLIVCTRNRAISILRKRKKLVYMEELAEGGVQIADDSPEASIEELIASRDLLEKAKAAIKKLDPRYGDVIWMQLEGYEVSEIAALFSEKADTIRKRLYRGRAMLHNAVMEGGAA